MAAVSLEEGTYLVSLARRAIEEHFAAGKKIKPDRAGGALSQELGVFVTLEEYPSRELRGCIGFPLPVKELRLAVVDAALSAAFEDPRFSPLAKGELGKTTVEVSVLSTPEEIKVKSPKEYPKKIKVGRDGLIINYGYSSGLLLPQVPVEWNWNETEFLSHICEKAGLPPDMWLSPSVKISSFTAQVFSEDTPGGRVTQKKLVKG
ncbi:MAG: TIGR00296 family protein [Candidatus Anstonellaceae archaeon]